MQCRGLGSGNPELPERNRGGNDFFISDLRHWTARNDNEVWFRGVLKHGVFRLDCTPLSITLE